MTQGCERHLRLPEGADAAPRLEAILATIVGRKPELKPCDQRRFEAAIKLARSGAGP